MTFLYSARLDGINVAMGNLQTMCNNEKPRTMSDMGAHWVCDYANLYINYWYQNMFMTYPMMWMSASLKQLY